VRPFTPEERAMMMANMQATYDTFVEKAAQGRNTTPERIDAIAQGRVWTGRQAKEIGLVDELGGLDRAISIAKQRAKIPQESGVEIVTYPGRRSFYDVLRNPFGPSDFGATLGALLGFRDPHMLAALAAPLQVFRRGEPLAIMPNVFVH
jgi:protease-4